jgi:hypothetical protein
MDWTVTHKTSLAETDFCDRASSAVATVSPVMYQDETSTFHEAQVQASLGRLQRTIPTDTSLKLRPQFEFVDGLKSKAGRKKARSFVTKQHYRRKKYEITTAARDGPEERLEQVSTSVSKQVLDTSSPVGESTSTAQDEDRSRVESLIRFQPPTETSSSLLRKLDGGRADPFDSYPVPGTRDVHELVDHYYFVIPSLVHRHWDRAIRRPRSCWDLFNLYRKHEIPFLGMLHHAAHHLATLRGQKESLQTMEFKHRSLEAVNRRLRVLNGPCDDWTLIGVGLLANAEVCPEEIH